MMKIDVERLKFIAGALVVAAAAWIMLPGILSVVAGVGRIFLIIVIAGGACLALAYAVHFTKRKNTPDQTSTNTSSSDANTL